MAGWYRRDDALAEHPKTKRVKRLLGCRLVEAVGWIDLFHSRVNQHRITGDLSGLNAQDIEDWVEWDGEPGALYEALCSAGWIDHEIVHGWDEMLGSSKWAEEKRIQRAKEKAKEAERLAKREAAKQRSDMSLDSPKTKPDMSSVQTSETSETSKTSLDNTSSASPPARTPRPRATVTVPGPSAEELVELWNGSVTRLPKVRELTDQRRRWAKARARAERTGEWWRAVFERLDASDFAAGGGWAGLDWLLKSEENVAKVLEGKYDNREDRSKETPTDRKWRELQEAARQIDSRGKSATIDLPFKLLSGGEA